jgi:uncharacterized protein
MANRLINEQSPYLLQHAHNPVDWYPWGNEAFEKAKKENKPVIVSIGYAACHWCHVMEHESFENEAVAAYMNEHFICIKVDREEHPGVDHMYMDAVQAINGSGGWPLNAFVTPERVPFYGGTYYPPKPMYGRTSWMQLLERMHEVWTEQPSEIVMQTGQMLQYLQQVSKQAVASAAEDWDKDTCKLMAENLLKQADTEFGGFGRAPKFPGSMSISYLLDHYHFTKNDGALKHALFSLDSMVEGGIYDQLAGGFARYATDDKWLIPHFEKMLYDNALILVSLCEAYSITKKPLYRQIIEETIAFVERELKEPSGGYYSALDADSEGVEGKYYTWTWEEWLNATGGGHTVAEQHFGISSDGNWDHTNILHVATTLEKVAGQHGLSLEEAEAQITSLKQRLLTERNKRVRPLTDDKSLLSWNALMNIALSKAAMVLDHSGYRQRAREHMLWMLKAFVNDEKIMHVWKNGEAKIAANLDDYAYLINAILHLSSAACNNEWILKAAELTEQVFDRFLHEDGNFFYYTSHHLPDIPVRKVETYDGATPSSNAVMAHNLLLLGISMERSDWMEQAYFMLRQMSGSALRYSYSFGYWCRLLQQYAEGIKLVISTGKDAELMHSHINQYLIPGAYTIVLQKEISEVPVLESKFSEGNNAIFICTQQACLAPVTSADAALQTLGIIK